MRAAQRDERTLGALEVAPPMRQARNLAFDRDVPADKISTGVRTMGSIGRQLAVEEINNTGQPGRRRKRRERLPVDIYGKTRRARKADRLAVRPKRHGAKNREAAARRFF